MAAAVGAAPPSPPKLEDRRRSPPRANGGGGSPDRRIEDVEAGAPPTPGTPSTPRTAQERAAILANVGGLVANAAGPAHAYNPRPTSPRHVLADAWAAEMASRQQEGGGGGVSFAGAAAGWLKRATAAGADAYRAHAREARHAAAGRRARAIMTGTGPKRGPGSPRSIDDGRDPFAMTANTSPSRRSVASSVPTEAAAAPTAATAAALSFVDEGEGRQAEAAAAAAATRLRLSPRNKKKGKKKKKRAGWM